MDLGLWRDSRVTGPVPLKRAEGLLQALRMIERGVA
jgi:hypothetical protein